MEMTLLLTCLGLMVGFVLGYLFSSRRAGSTTDLYQNLLKQESAAQEKIRNLWEESKARSEELSKHRETVLALNKELAQFQAKYPHLESTLEEMKIEKDSARKIHDELNLKFYSTNATVSSLQTEKQLLEQQLRIQRDYVDEVKKQTKMEFENLANQVLDAKTKSFNEHTEKSLDTLLKPLREKIQTFEKNVDEKYTTEAKERHALKSEIERLITLNDKMAFETSSLTQALRGDSKVQGDWGELVLERILEASGLREGSEYSLQKSHNDEDGERYRPDVIINLPESKHVVVDSKVSLKAYDLNRSTTDEAVQTKSIEDHIKSIEKHVDDLSEKHYSKLKGVNSPEVVFMFIPIEPAYMLAMQKDPELSSRAWKKNVAIVTSTTLLISLKTMASIWRLEKQNKNAVDIAQEGAKLYDKFVGFLEDFEKIGNTLESGQKQYLMAMGKLKDGPGNVFRKMELLRELGASPNKKIKPELLE